MSTVRRAGCWKAKMSDYGKYIDNTYSRMAADDQALGDAGEAASNELMESREVFEAIADAARLIAAGGGDPSEILDELIFGRWQDNFERGAYAKGYANGN